VKTEKQTKTQTKRAIIETSVEAVDFALAALEAARHGFGWPAP
jgi:hypothetical protein